MLISCELMLRYLIVVALSMDIMAIGIDLRVVTAIRGQNQHKSIILVHINIVVSDEHLEQRKLIGFTTVEAST